jgi:beta-galactosidase
MEATVPGLNRRDFVCIAGTSGLVLPFAEAEAKGRGGKLRTQNAGDNALPLPDDGWHLWIDEKAAWKNDDIYLPEDVNLTALPVNPPTGGWEVLGQDGDTVVTLPATVEQHFWGKFGSRPYSNDEFSYAYSDKEPQNGAYTGVSWWWREISIPAAFKGKRIILNIRGARQRAEVFLNRKLVGYSILEELPFDCDLTDAALPGGKNVLAIRITNPGGRFDWIDGDTLQWGKLRIQRSHGFGGIDRGMTMSAHPKEARLADLWVLNRPQPGQLQVFAAVEFAVPPTAAAAKAQAAHLAFAIAGDKTGRALPAKFRLTETKREGRRVTYRFAATAKGAKVWDLDNPNLYRLAARFKATKGISSRMVRFGFRWFDAADVGSDAHFTFNGRRIKLYSAISWGYWGFNGLWPTPSLAEKEVTQAKALGLNTLAFHRNPGKHDVLLAQDRLGLLRGMEPGGGKFTLGILPKGTKTDQHSVIMVPPVEEADKFLLRYELTKCLHMMRAFRSHPCLVHWTLQNENNADLSDPRVTEVLAAMRAEDESRIILMNDGMSSPEFKAAQAWYAPYDAKLHRSDKEPWGYWWDDHQGAGDQWYDAFYKGPKAFTYMNRIREGIVQYGEMEGCAVPDNHTLMVAEILQQGGKSYDLADHKEILTSYQAFLDRWNFRGAFPNAEALFLSIGRKSYASWMEYMENARLCDEIDYATISGWESTAIDNHSGIVDNQRNFKSDPELIRGSLLPVRPVAKQRALVQTLGEKALFDFYLLNDTGKPVSGQISFSMTDPAGQKSMLAQMEAPAMAPGVFSALIQEGFATPALTQEGFYSFEFALPGYPVQKREIWVTDALRAPVKGRTLRVGVAGIWPSLRAQLAKVPGISVEDFSSSPFDLLGIARYDVLIASGLTSEVSPGQKLGGDEGFTMVKKSGLAPVPGALPEGMLAAVKDGTPILLMPQEDGLAEGVAKQLADAGALRFGGSVGRYRAPWMGNWYFVRSHPVYAGMPENRAMDGYFQSPGRLSNGVVVDGSDVDVFVGYSRDHERKVGAGTFSARLGKGKILFQRVPDMVAPMQLRFLSNALGWLCA